MHALRRSLIIVLISLLICIPAKMTVSMKYNIDDTTYIKAFISHILYSLRNSNYLLYPLTVNLTEEKERYTCVACLGKWNIFRFMGTYAHI